MKYLLGLKFQGENTMAKSLKKIRIFVASPSDVASERVKLETVVESLGLIADYLNLTLEIVDWRTVVPDAGRPQQIIFDQLKPTSWDIFIGILWHRFGTPPGAKDQSGKDYLSGTEEEFKTAYELWKQHNKPRMVLYRCIRALPFDVDPDQLSRVRDFFKLIEDVKGDYPTLYQAFDTTEAFEKLLLDNLQKLLFEYGEKSKIPLTPDVIQVLGPTIPNNLPRRSAFFGRASEMDQVIRALSPTDRTWGILVDGIGGIGKTSLAIEAAYRAQDTDMFDVFIFVTAKQNILAPGGIRKQTPAARTLDEFLNETARGLGHANISKLVGNKKRQALLDVLRMKRTLLIYDNLETLSKEEQETVADFLRELPLGSKAIITSRRRGGEGSVWLRLGRLEWDAARGIIENELVRDMGLADKMKNYKQRWQELYDEANGSPLALVHILGLLRVRAALSFEGALKMLRGAHRKDDLVKFVYQEARKDLTPNDKLALSALSYFAPFAMFDSWMRVVGLSRNALETTIDRLSALSLVDVRPGEEKYSIHPLTRVYIQDDLLTDKKLADKLEMAFVTYWAIFVSQHSENKNESFDSYYLLEVEWQNIKTALHRLLKRIKLRRKRSTIEEETAYLYLRMGIALEDFLLLGGRWDERQELGSNGYTISVALDNLDVAGWCAYYTAWVDGTYGRNLPNKAKTWIEKCVKMWAKSDDENLVREAIRLLGLNAIQFKRYKLAERYLKKALSLSRKARDKYDVMNILNDLGKLSFEQDKINEAKKYYQQALVIAKKIKSKEGKAFTSANLGEVAIKQKQMTDASKTFRSALPLAQKVGRIDLIARIKYGLACVWESKGRDEKAISLAKESLLIFQKLHHPHTLDSQKFINKLEKRSNKK